MGPKLLLSTLSLTSISLIAADGDIYVQGKYEPQFPESIPVSTKSNALDPDSAMMLDRIPGITIGRKGAHGNEVILRGLKDQNLNILIEDKFLHGGCPNKMDPVTSYIAPEFYEEVEIEMGVVTLSEGRGGPGGSIRFKEKRPDFSQKPLSFSIGSGFEDNSNTQNHFVQAATGTSTVGIKTKYSYKDAKNYEDGHGNEILSSFNQQNSGVKLYWNPTLSTHLDLSYDYDLAKDVLYQGLSMNSPRSLAQSIQLRGEHERADSFIKKIKGAAYQTNVDHLMANSPTSSSYMTIQVDSITQGGKVEAHYGDELHSGIFGVDIQNLEQTTYRQISNGSYNPIHQPMFVNQWGLFAEHEWEAFSKILLKVGLRYDHVSAHSEKLGIKPSMMFNSAITEYHNVYGYTGDSEASETEHNFSALVRLNQKLKGNWQHALSLSRTVRTASPFERYIYRPHMMATMRQIGNPGLSPEQHHQVDYSILWHQNKETDFKFNLYYNQVSDFITLDRARGQAGILVSDKRQIYRNIDALLMGATLSASHALNKELIIGTSLNYTYGKNRTDKRALYEIPPVILNLNLDYQWMEQLSSKFEIVSQLKQTRIDSDTNLGAGVDAGESKAWASVNLSLEATPIKYLENWKLRAGVRNLMDKAYARHLNRSDILTASQVRVNEPGRTLWLSTEYRF